MQHIEEVLILVRNVIRTNIAARLTAITTEKADGIALPPPLTTSYAINELDAIAEFPFIQCVPDTTQTLIPGGTWDEDEHNIIIKVHNVSYEGDIEACGKRSYRYARAISKIIRDNRTINNNVISFYRTSINYTPMMTDGTGFKQEIWIDVVVKKHSME